MTRDNHTKRYLLVIGVIVLLLLIDQAIKITVKTSMMLGESVRITDWFYIYFTENPGMAFGWEVFNKAFLSLFRIIASIGLLWLTFRAAKRKEYPTGFLVCLAAIFSGAAGNIIDSIFYGVIFDHSVGQVATLFPEMGGYAGWLHGKVVDMFYFPLVEGYFPSWVPYVGGDHFIFFRPIFNFADSCIFCGVVMMLLLYSKSFGCLLNGHPKECSNLDNEKSPADE